MSVEPSEITHKQASVSSYKFLVNTDIDPPRPCSRLTEGAGLFPLFMAFSEVLNTAFLTGAQ